MYDPKSMLGNSPKSSTSSFGNTVQNAKRKINEVSPEPVETNEQVGKMSIHELLCLMQNSMSVLLDEKLKNVPTKTDLLQHMQEVKSDVSKLASENKALHDEVVKLKVEREEDRQRMRKMEEDLGKKKLIIRGLACQKSAKDAVKKMFNEILKVQNDVEIEYSKKIYEGNDKMTVMVELKSAGMVAEVFKHTKNLKGTHIFVDRDLCAERQQVKKIMLQLKSDILNVDKSKRIGVRNDKMVIDGKWFAWNKNKLLMCGQKTGEEELVNMYGEAIVNVSLDYDKILAKKNSKNF